MEGGPREKLHGVIDFPAGCINRRQMTGQLIKKILTKNYFSRMGMQISSSESGWLFLYFSPRISK